MRISKCAPQLARRQAAWIAAIDPWRALGYEARSLGRWLARTARAGNVWCARDTAGVRGIVVMQPDVLLGDFIALLAVHPHASARGMGRALIAHVATRTFRRRRWLYVSSDRANTAAARFYRRLGFTPVGRLPDLISRGHTEILWRKARG